MYPRKRVHRRLGPHGSFAWSSFTDNVKDYHGLHLQWVHIDMLYHTPCRCEKKRRIFARSITHSHTYTYRGIILPIFRACGHCYRICRECCCRICHQPNDPWKFQLACPILRGCKLFPFSVRATIERTAPSWKERGMDRDEMVPYESGMSSHRY